MFARRDYLCVSTINSQQFHHLTPETLPIHSTLELNLSQFSIANRRQGLGAT